MLNRDMTTTNTNAGHDIINVGDVFYASWGYDQTNVNFYEVIRVTPSGKSVEVQPIESVIETAGGPNGNRVLPARGNVRRWDVLIDTNEDKRTKVCRVRSTFDGSPALVLSRHYTAWKHDGSSKYETDTMFGH